MITDRELKKIIFEHISMFLKICPICGESFKDTLDNMISCRNCNRNDKINKIINDKYNF
jgi:hypothetical protein